MFFYVFIIYIITKFGENFEDKIDICFFKKKIGPRLTSASQPRWINPTIFNFFVETFPYGSFKFKSGETWEKFPSGAN